MVAMAVSRSLTMRHFIENVNKIAYMIIFLWDQCHTDEENSLLEQTCFSFFLSSLQQMYIQVTSLKTLLCVIYPCLPESSIGPHLPFLVIFVSSLCSFPLW